MEEAKPKPRCRKPRKPKPIELPIEIPIELCCVDSKPIKSKSYYMEKIAEMSQSSVYEDRIARLEQIIERLIRRHIPDLEKPD